MNILNNIYDTKIDKIKIKMIVQNKNIFQKIIKIM